jgi:hypothetical protein
MGQFARPSATEVASMMDYQASLEKLRKDAAEAALIRDLAMDGTKRELFDRLYEHLNRSRASDERSDSLRTAHSW